MHVGLHPVTGKPANFIGGSISALKSREGKKWTERLQASAHMCVHLSTQPPFNLSISISMGWTTQGGAN